MLKKIIPKESKKKHENNISLKRKYLRDLNYKYRTK